MKVSFKNDCGKVEIFNHKATVVTLEGQIQYPEKLEGLPWDIRLWAAEYEGVTVYPDGGKIIAKGLSVRAEEDEDDHTVAERIAESKAKIKIYRFMEHFTSKLTNFYSKLIFGESDIIELYIDRKNGGLHQEIAKYKKLLEREQEHLKKLLSEA